MLRFVNDSSCEDFKEDRVLSGTYVKAAQSVSVLPIYD